MWDIRGSLYDGAASWSKSQLERLAESLAGQIVANTDVGDHVAIAIENDAVLVCAVIACSLTDRVSVLLSSRAPAKESIECELLLQRMNNANARLAFLDGVHRPLISREGHVLIDPQIPDVPDLSMAVRRASISYGHNMDGAAIVLYTSGSTSTPKGVVLSRTCLAHLHDVNQKLYEWSREDRFLSVLPLVHSAGLFNVLSAISGGADVFRGPSFAWPGKVVAFCARHRISVAGIVPYYLSRLVVCEQLPELSSVRLVVSSAAPLSIDSIDRLLDALPEAGIVNAYGLTEAFRSLVLPAEEIRHRLPSIGRPVSGIRAEVRDPEGDRLLSDGEQGEIWLKGPSVMLGYWRDDERTAEVMADGWMRTGDVGSRRDDGSFVLSGRSTNIVNGGGEKLCCETIEQCLAERCGLDEVAVAGEDNGTGRDTIVAVVAARKPRSVNDLRKACSGRLHTAFWPTEILMVNELPRNVSGKLDRGAISRICREYLSATQRSDVNKSPCRAC